ncbi:hypothetical protein EJB05_12093, partial [Eragrostis curvula]
MRETGKACCYYAALRNGWKPETMVHHPTKEWQEFFSFDKLVAKTCYRHSQLICIKDGRFPDILEFIS